MFKALFNGGHFCLSSMGLRHSLVRLVRLTRLVRRLFSHWVPPHNHAHGFEHGHMARRLLGCEG